MTWDNMGGYTTEAEKERKQKEQEEKSEEGIHPSKTTPERRRQLCIEMLEEMKGHLEENGACQVIAVMLDEDHRPIGTAVTGQPVAISVAAHVLQKEFNSYASDNPIEAFMQRMMRQQK